MQIASYTNFTPLHRETHSRKLEYGKQEECYSRGFNSFCNYKINCAFSSLRTSAFVVSPTPTMLYISLVLYPPFTERGNTGVDFLCATNLLLKKVY